MTDGFLRILERKSAFHKLNTSMYVPIATMPTYEMKAYLFAKRKKYFEGRYLQSYLKIFIIGLF